MEIYKDPRWQKKRLKIFERDSYICRRCQKSDRTLHIHHLFYLDKFRERAPWEYPDWALTTLCEVCHETVTLNKRNIDYVSWDTVWAAFQWLSAAVDDYYEKGAVNDLFIISVTETTKMYVPLETTFRVIADLSGIPFMRLVNFDLLREDWPLLVKAAARMEEWFKSGRGNDDIHIVPS
jgi:hypothetical protein